VRVPAGGVKINSCFYNLQKRREKSIIKKSEESSMAWLKAQLGEAIDWHSGMGCGPSHLSPNDGKVVQVVSKLQRQWSSEGKGSTPEQRGKVFVSRRDAAALCVRVIVWQHHRRDSTIKQPTSGS
jgi:hypothetical protein